MFSAWLAPLCLSVDILTRKTASMLWFSQRIKCEQNLSHLAKIVARLAKKAHKYNKTQ